MMKAFIVNERNEASEIFDWEGKDQPIGIKIFHAEDEESLRNVRAFFRHQKNGLTQDVIATMKELRATMNLTPLRDMILKYFGVWPCCIERIDEVLHGL